MINVNDFIDLYSKQFGTSKKEARIVCESVFTLMNKLLLIDNKNIKIKDFGTFKWVERAAKKIKHPITGEAIKVPARKIIKFQHADENAK